MSLLVCYYWGQKVKLAIKIEALLYIKGQPLAVAEIASSLQDEPDKIEEAIIELMASWRDHRSSGDDSRNLAVA